MRSNFQGVPYAEGKAEEMEKNLSLVPSFLMFPVRILLRKSCSLTPEYESGDEPGKRIIVLGDNGASGGKDSQ